MKKLAYVFAALATIAVAAPTFASAEEFGFRVGGDHEMYGHRSEFRGDRDWGSLATPPLPHHRTYGSVYGGSAIMRASVPRRKPGRVS